MRGTPGSLQGDRLRVYAHVKCTFRYLLRLGFCGESDTDFQGSLN